MQRLTIGPTPYQLDGIRCRGVHVKADRSNSCVVYANAHSVIRPGQEVFLACEYGSQVFLHSQKEGQKVIYHIDPLSLADREEIAAAALADLIMHALTNPDRTLKALETVNGRS